MPGIGLAVGALIFIVGLVLIGMSGSRLRGGVWFGPSGAALTALGLALELTSVMGR